MIKRLAEATVRDDNQHYYRSELNSLLPIDRFGVKMQLSSTSGKTKVLDLNEDSLSALLEWIRTTNLPIKAR